MEAIVNIINHFPLIKVKEKVVVDTKKLELLERIKETKARLKAMRTVFECETNFDLIEVYILEINALEHQFSYLIKQAKQANIVASVEDFSF